MRIFLIILLAFTGCAGTLSKNSAPNQNSVKEKTPVYVLLEYVDGSHTQKLPLAKELDHKDPRRLAVERAFQKPYLRWVLQLGVEAKRRAILRCSNNNECKKRFGHPAYFVFVQGGNRPKQGLAIVDKAGTKQFPLAWYTEIDTREIVRLIPHEYGHVMMFESLPGDLPQHPFTLPHTTGTISDDVTAFTEGWGIHFETLAANCKDHTNLYAQTHRDALAVWEYPIDGDSFLLPRDLLSYSQNYKRYTCVKENCFSYLPRMAERLASGAKPTTRDLVARWTDTTYDPAKLRSLEQMVASEGVIATLFYRLATEPNGSDIPDPRRYAAFFDAFSKLTEKRVKSTPMVLAFFKELLKEADSKERKRIAQIFLDVFHYTPFLRDAQQIYGSLHEAGHQMDMSEFVETIKAASPRMSDAIEKLAANPDILDTIAAPEIWLKNDMVKLAIEIFRIENQPLFFDLNTAPVEFLMTIPGVSLEQAIAIDTHRLKLGGFQTEDDLASIPNISPPIIAAVKSMRQSFLERQNK
ncbi:MAG: helix-hairpin-helix domain-containing protein [Pseudomonadota bacterium]